ncbi:hypothetical protein CEXT_599311 [Caerostris extrusa]|uniref:Uncharacterized protein n=1 Tax=Caerostris extrusa TaxID=172846 RepID=A0AAV4P725_CAEEX|nr:hypothetical protein CEXT_599311 [Caerostris extrusa]
MPREKLTIIAKFHLKWCPSHLYFIAKNSGITLLEVMNLTSKSGITSRFKCQVIIGAEEQKKILKREDLEQKNKRVYSSRYCGIHCGILQERTLNCCKSNYSGLSYYSVKLYIKQL